jgi:hypothetical protein
MAIARPLNLAWQDNKVKHKKLILVIVERVSWFKSSLLLDRIIEKTVSIGGC